MKEDFGFSTSEITIGKTFRILGQLILSLEEGITQSQSVYRTQLMQHLKTLKTSPPRHPANRKTYLENSLRDYTHVFIQNAPNRPPLASAYSGPYCVLSKHGKPSTIDLLSRIDNVSIDRIKAANLILPLAVENDPPDQQPTSRGGTEVSNHEGSDLASRKDSLSALPFSSSARSPSRIPVPV